MSTDFYCTEADQKNIELLKDAIDRIEKKVDKEKRAYTSDEEHMLTELRSAFRELCKKPSRPFVPKETPLAWQIFEEKYRGTRNTEPSPARGHDYRSMFGIDRGKSLDNGGFKSFNEYLTVLSSGRFDERLLESRTMGETVPSEGGFSVPEQYSSWLLDSSLESEIVRPRATVYPMRSNVLKVPGWDSATHTSTLFGGLTGTWLAELGAATEVFAKMRMIELNAKKLACYTAASNELVQDGIDFDNQITIALVKTIGWYLDYAFLRGTAGQPLGVLNDPALVTVTPETGQRTATIVWENCVKMYARLAPQCMGNAVWVASQTCVPQLLTMSLAVGTGGAPIQPAVLQSNGQFSLLGKPMLFTEKLPAVGTKGDLLLCDFSQYIIGLRKEVSLDKSIHVGWSTDQSSYRAIVRADGQGSWDKSITPKAGDSLSWCVCLDTRT